jgi:membrane protein YqaA with SNARE-associated domain
VILDYLAVAGLVFAINLLPAFGPPTSAVLVSITLSADLAPVPLVACAALAAASGRYVLASGTRRLRPRLSERRRENLDALEERLTTHRGRTIAGLGLFALSPVPSGQLFVAAGLMRVRLLPLTAAFFCGRLVSYSIYVAGAAAIRESVGDALVDGLRSPLGLAAQLLALGALVLLLRVDWADRLGEGRGDDASAGAEAPGTRR